MVVRVSVTSDLLALVELAGANAERAEVRAEVQAGSSVSELRVVR
jgi:hypothetical protein